MIMHEGWPRVAGFIPPPEARPVLGLTLASRIKTGLFCGTGLIATLCAAGAGCNAWLAWGDADPSGSASTDAPTDASDVADLDPEQCVPWQTLLGLCAGALGLAGAGLIAWQAQRAYASHPPRWAVETAAHMADAELDPALAWWLDGTPADAAALGDPLRRAGCAAACKAWLVALVRTRAFLEIPERQHQRVGAVLTKLRQHDGLHASCFAMIDNAFGAGAAHAHGAQRLLDDMERKVDAAGSGAPPRHDPVENWPHGRLHHAEAGMACVTRCFHMPAIVRAFRRCVRVMPRQTASRLW